MDKQFIKYLEKQLTKLEAEDFDLEAWKSSASAALNRIFGKGNDRSEQVENLKIDYSSWALRDSNSKYKPVESCKRKGKEIIESAIEEIEAFGIPKPKEDLLAAYFSKSDVAMLLSENDKKGKIVKQLKKEVLLKLLVELIDMK